MPGYYKFFNRHRRACNYNFKVDEGERVVLFNRKTTFYFIGYRRMIRYLYPDGIKRITDLMRKKYCISYCTIDHNDIVVEIGANTGEFTIMAARTAGKVFAFEPDPDCYICLKKNTKTLDNVEVINQGVSNNNSRKNFYLSGEDADSSFIKPVTFKKRIETDAIRLDTWMELKGLSGIDFLKVEAEGAELEVLEGLGDKIEYVNKVSVDGGAERFGESTSSEVNQFLRLKGFNTYTSSEDQVYAWKS